MKKHDLSDDARDVLDEIEDMSRCNATSGTTRNVIVRSSTGETVAVTLPWAAALAVRERTSAAQAESVAARLFVRHTGAERHELSYGVVRHRARAWTLGLRDGDRPADLTDDEYERLTYPGRAPRLETRDALSLAMDQRVGWPYKDSERLIRSTHRAVHRALTGEDTRGCKWCEATR